MCHRCDKTFAESRGTAFYRLHYRQETMVQVMTLLAHGCPPQALVAAFDLDERTVAAWQQRAGGHCQAVHEALVQQPRDLQHVQADEIRVKGQGQVLWMALALMVGTRLWLAGVISPKRDYSLIAALCQQIRACALCRPLLCCVDGLAAYVSALQATFRSPQATGKRGRPRLLPWEEVCIGQVIKRYERKHVVAVVRRMALGTLEQALRLLQECAGGTMLNTAYIERLNATFRARLAALTRRTRASVRKAKTLRKAMYLIGTVYNFCSEHDSLRLPPSSTQSRRGLARTPAMAAGITDHCWTVTELLAYRMPLAPWQPPKRRGRPPKSQRSNSTVAASTL